MKFSSLSTGVAEFFIFVDLRVPLVYLFISLFHVMFLDRVSYVVSVNDIFYSTSILTSSLSQCQKSTKSVAACYTVRYYLMSATKVGKFENGPSSLVNSH